MARTEPPQLDMTLDGEFVSPPAPPTLPLSTRILFGALVVALIAGCISIAALALWLALVILPVAVAAGVVAWGIYRFRLWQAHRSLGSGRDLRHP